MDDIEYNRQMEYDMMMNELLSMGADIDEYQKEMNYDLIGDVFPDTDVDIKKLIIVNEDANDNKSSSKNNVLLFAVRSEDVYMKNKDCNYNDYSILNYMSKRNPNEEHRYIYRKDIRDNKIMIEELSKKKIENYFKSINKIIKIGNLILPKEINGEAVYIINNKDANNRKYVLLEKDIMRYLIDTGDKYLTKLYVLLKYRCNTKTYTKISRKDMAESIGLSPNSGSTLTKITNLIVNLNNNNLIESYTEYDNKINSKGNIEFARHINIKLTTYGYWKNKYEEVKNNKEKK